MTDTETAREAVAALGVDEIADAVEELGFACTDCGACCRSDGDDEHIATIFPEEVRQLQDRVDGEWRDVARPMPFGWDGDSGETFEWALQTDGCGDCAFYRPDAEGGSCGVYEDRPHICRTYPFQLAIPGLSTPNATAVEQVGPVLAYECEGLGRDIDRETAIEMARRLQRRALEELDQQARLLEQYEPRTNESVPVVHDAEGAKRPDGKPLDSPS